MEKILRFFQAVWFVWRNGVEAVFCDQLTGLYNRTFFDGIGGKILAQARRSKDNCAVVLIDVDGLKPVNDSLGHEAGDKLLKKVATTIVAKTHWRESDYAFRWGGDEILLFLFSASMAGAERLMGKIESDLREQNISISFGIIATDKDPLSFHGNFLERIVGEADRRMYEQKGKKGNNRS